MENIKPQFIDGMQPQFNVLGVASKTMSTLAERVTEAIRESGVDVNKAAKACGISVQAVYKWMNGLSKTIAGEPLVELARLTNYEERWLISGKGEKLKNQRLQPKTEQTLSPYIRFESLLDDLATLQDEDVELFKQEIKLAAMKARKKDQERRDRELAAKALDPPIDERRTA